MKEGPREWTALRRGGEGRQPGSSRKSQRWRLKGEGRQSKEASEAGPGGFPRGPWGMAGRQEWRGSWVVPSRAADAQRRPTRGRAVRSVSGGRTEEVWWRV